MRASLASVAAGRLPARWTPATVLALLALGAGACGGGARNPFQNPGPRTDLTQVQEVVIRFITSNYTPRARAGAVQGWCLAVGRRAANAVDPNRRGRNETYNPSAQLLARLGGIRPPVYPVSECGVDDGLQERLLENNAPTVLLVVGFPLWETQDLAIVRVYTRESPNDEDAATCRLRRGLDGWEIRECV